VSAVERVRAVQRSFCGLLRALAVVAALFILLVPRAAFAQGYDAAGWLADFGQLQRAMADHYANLEWAIVWRRFDVPALVAQTNDALRSANSDADAHKAIERFLAAFGDAHIEVDWTAQKDDGGSTRGPLCARLGYSRLGAKPGIQFPLLVQGAPLQTTAAAYFPTNVFTLRDRSRVGVLRIFAFSAKRFADLCAEARTTLRLADDAPCDDACSDRVQLAAENGLTRRLTAAIKGLEAVEGLRAVVVDLTGDGGGSDWLEPAARELTARPLLSPHEGFVRSELWTAELRTRLGAIDADLPRVDAADRPAFVAARKLYAQLLAESRKRCDRAPLLRGSTIACTQVVYSALTTSGSIPYAAPGSLPALDASQYVFAPSAYEYAEGVYRGPLYVLVDQNTASAAERFAAMLRDASVAKVVGVPTAGAGCGYTNGGIPTVLAHSGATVRLPDCVQYRADLSDAVAGITPDVLVPWRLNDSPYQRAERAYEGLVSAIAGS
jgi:hypothetical protein